MCKKSCPQWLGVVSLVGLFILTLKGHQKSSSRSHLKVKIWLYIISRSSSSLDDQCHSISAHNHTKITKHTCNIPNSLIIVYNNVKYWHRLFQCRDIDMFFFCIPTQLAIYGCSNVSTTLGESYENFGKIKLLQHISGKFLKNCLNVAAKSCRKTSPPHHGNIHSFRQRATIFTMLWQPFCNMGKSA